MTDTRHGPENQDAYPTWTIRFTWAVLDTDGKPKRTHEGPARTESEAVDRAVFELDHSRNGTSALVCAEVKRPDGLWHDVPRSSRRLYSAAECYPARVA